MTRWLAAALLAIGCSADHAPATVADATPETFDSADGDASDADTATAADVPTIDATDTEPALRAATPTFDPPPGTYCERLRVSLASSTPAATIHYTLDGTPPTNESALYSAPIEIATTTTVRALAVAAGHAASDVALAVYSITALAAVAPPPRIAPAAGAYASDLVVTLEQPESSVMCFTIDGGEMPSCVASTMSCAKGTKYVEPFVVKPTPAGVTVRAISCTRCYSPDASSMVTATYTLK